MGLIHSRNLFKKEADLFQQTLRIMCTRRSYNCDEKGHFARDCPIRKRRHHAHIVEDDERTNKIFIEEKDDLDEEHVLISALTVTISHRSNDWLVDSGAFKHMMGYMESFINMSEHELPFKVKIGDYYHYPIKGSGEASYKLDSRKSLKMKDMLYVPGLKKNIPSIFSLDS